VKINTHMINTMDFGRLKSINGVRFRLNVINDFDAVTMETTEVELLKVITADNPAKITNTTTKKPKLDTNVLSGGVDSPLISSPPYTGVLVGGMAGYSDYNSNVQYG